MAILKRISAPVGDSRPAGSRVGSSSDICRKCHRHTQMIPSGGKLVCSICGQGADDKR